MNSPGIFARARAAPPLPAKPATPADIVAAIPLPAALQAAQAALDGLHRRRQETHSALLVAIRDQPDLDRQSTGGPSTRKIETLGRELDAIDKELQIAHAEWKSARFSYTAAVASALAPMRRSAIDAAITAISELVTALRTIDSVTREIERAGGTGMRFPAVYRNGVAALRARLQLAKQ